jgi:hypothetical protein
MGPKALKVLVVATLAAAALIAPAGAQAALPVPTSAVTADADVSSIPLAPKTGTKPMMKVGLLDRSYVRFSVAGLPVPPQRAVLRIYATDGTAAGTEVRSAATAWSETTVGYGSAPATTSGTLAKLPRVATGQYAEYDVTSAVQGDGTYAFAILGLNLDTLVLATRESGRPPQLVLTTRNTAQELIAHLSSPTRADASRYQTTDDLGASLDCLQVAHDPSTGGYLGVHHTLVNGRFVAKVATSTDLLRWTHRADLEIGGSQPTIAASPSGGWIVATESDADPNLGLHLRFRHYATTAALLGAQPDAQFDAPRTLAPTAEGTPNIIKITGGPTLSSTIIDVGFHYYRNQDVDRQALGTLTGFAGWTTRVDTQRNAVFEALGVAGNLGDRDDLVFRGLPFTLHEGQLVKNDFGSWREFLYDPATASAQQLAIRTAGGSLSFGNGTAAILPGPGGTAPVVFASYFIFGSGAAPGEAGQLVFYRRIP